MAELKVGIDGRGAETGARKVKKSLDKIRGAAGKTGDQFKKTRKEFDKTRRSAFSLGRVLGGLSILFAARALGQYANSFQEINNRLRLVTDSSEQLVKVQEKVFDIAQRNRIGFESTAELFQRVARSSETLGLSLDDVLAVTDSVSKAITLSGVAAQSANAAIVQLGQGLAAGALRGDELRSVLEQTPRLARAIADGLGVPIGKLRELGQAGELTAQKVIAALQSQADILESEFGKTVPTISQAFTVLRNSMIRTVGIFAESTGAAGGFADALIGLAGFIQGPLLQGVLKFGDVLGVTFSEARKVFARTISAFGGLGVDVNAIAGDIGRAILHIPLNITRFINRAIVEIVNGLGILRTRVFGFFNDVTTGFAKFQNALVGTIATALGDDAVAEQAAMARVQIEQDAANEKLRLNQELVGQLATLEADRAQLVEDSIAQENRLEDAINQRTQARLDALNADTSQRGAGTTTVDIDPKILTNIQKVIDSTLTPLEAYTARITELQGLLANGLPAENYTRAVLTAAEAFQEAEGDITGFNDKLSDAATLFDDTRTNAELYAIEQDRLNTLLAEGFISQDTFNRGLDAAASKFDDNTRLFEEFATQAARNIQTAFADFLFDPFSEGLDGMLFKFAETTKKIAAEALANAILKSVFAAIPGGGALSLALAGNQFGGPVQAGVPSLINEEGSAKGEVFVPNQSGRVMTKAQASEASNPNINVPVAITNVTDPSQAIAAIESNQGKKAIMNVIQTNPATIKRLLS